MATNVETMNGILKLLNDPQLKYQRIHLTDYIKQLAPKPAAISNKIALPSFFKSLFSDNLTVHSVSGKKYSFWHCLLYAMYPRYIELSWYQRKYLVDGLLDQLSADLPKFVKKTPELSELNIKWDSVRWTDHMPSEELKYYLVARFRINLIIVDTSAMEYHYAGTDYRREDPTIVLYRDDSPTYRVVAVDDVVVSQHSQGLAALVDLVPETNPFLAKHVSKKKLDTYSKVHHLTEAEKFRLNIQPSLGKLKAVELRALAEKYEIPTKKQGKTKMVLKKKSELIEDIIAYHTD